MITSFGECYQWNVLSGCHNAYANNLLEKQNSLTPGSQVHDIVHWLRDLLKFHSISGFSFLHCFVISPAAKTADTMFTVPSISPEQQNCFSFICRCKQSASSPIIINYWTWPYSVFTFKGEIKIFWWPKLSWSNIFSGACTLSEPKSRVNFHT